MHRKARYRIIGFVFAIIFACSFFNSALAAEASLSNNTLLQDLNNLEIDAKLERVSEVLSDLSMMYATNLRNNELGNTAQSLHSVSSSPSFPESYERELEELGVSRITYAEVLEMFPIADADASSTNSIIVPPSSGSVRWYATSPTIYHKNGTPYKVQFLYAQATDVGTNLCKIFNGRMYEFKEYVFQATQELAGIYLQKAIDCIP